MNIDTSNARRIQFCAGHVLLGHEGKCRFPHGHNYVAWFHARVVGDGALDTVGRVVDFSVLKARLGGWIEEHWDHGFIYKAGDDRAKAMLKAFHEGDATPYAPDDTPMMPKHYVMETNPTAENMAALLLQVAQREMEGTGAQVWRVTLQETENCTADVRLDDG